MKILIATDGSNASESIVEAACETIGDQENTTVKIITAVEPLAPMTAEPFAISAQYYGEVGQASRDCRRRRPESARHRIAGIGACSVNVKCEARNRKANVVGEILARL